MMETVGVYLKKARESKNISLREVSRLTKISELYLDYIEKDEFEKLPQGPYAKGYIASYSRLIGSDVDEAIKLYESLNKKRTLVEEIPYDIPDQNGSDDLSELPIEKAHLQSSPSPPAEETMSPIDTAASHFKAKCASLKAATPSIKTIFDPLINLPSTLTAIRSKRNVTPSSPEAEVVSTNAIDSSAPVATNSIKAFVQTIEKTALAVTTNLRLFHLRTWLYIGLSLLGTAFIVLAGFGFYHLFIFDKNELAVVVLNENKDKPPLPRPALESEKADLPATSGDASSSPNFEPATPGFILKPEKETVTAKAAIKSEPPLSEPPPPSMVDNGTASPSAVINADTAQSRPRSTAAQDSPDSVSVDSNVSVLQASVCSEINNRMPTGVDTSFLSSAQRVYVWNAIEAQQIPTKIRHIYYFKGQVISDVALSVRSPYWRTWSYKNMANDRYRGEWRVDIATVDGKVLRRLYFEVK